MDLPRVSARPAAPVRCQQSRHRRIRPVARRAAGRAPRPAWHSWVISPRSAARPEGTAQLADLGLRGIARIRGLAVVPQRVGQPVGADPRATVQGQQGTLLGARTGVTTPSCAASSSPKSCTAATPPHGQSRADGRFSFATALAGRLSAATVPPQAGCASFIRRPHIERRTRRLRRRSST